METWLKLREGLDCQFDVQSTCGSNKNEVGVLGFYIYFYLLHIMWKDPLSQHILSKEDISLLAIKELSCILGKLMSKHELISVDVVNYAQFWVLLSVMPWMVRWGRDASGNEEANRQKQSRTSPFK